MIHLLTHMEAKWGPNWKSISAGVTLKTFQDQTRPNTWFLWVFFPWSHPNCCRSIITKCFLCVLQQVRTQLSHKLWLMSIDAIHACKNVAYHSHSENDQKYPSFDACFTTKKKSGSSFQPGGRTMASLKSSSLWWLSPPRKARAWLTASQPQKLVTSGTAFRRSDSFT